MRKYIIILTLIASASASASVLAIELDMKKGTDYNGGDEQGNICSIQLLESSKVQAIVEVRPNSFTTKFKGPARKFILSRVGLNTFRGNGSSQIYISPKTTIYNADEVLVLETHNDGTPATYGLSSKTKNSKVICNGLLEAPF